MGRTKKGAIGSVEGKVGPLVYYKWKDKDCVRTRPYVKKNRELSVKETKNRSKFACVQHFLSQLTPILRLGFHNYEANQTAFNSAMSYTLHNAVRSDENGQYHIDHNALRISKGIPSPLKDVMLTYENDTLTCTWDYDAIIVRDLDLANFRSLFVMIPDNPLTFVGNLLEKAIDKKQEQISNSSIENNQLYHVHLGFVATDHSNRRIDSIYVGSIAT